MIFQDLLPMLLAKALAEISEYHGVTGSLRYQPGTGDPIKGAVIMQIKDGRFVWFADVEP